MTSKNAQTTEWAGISDMYRQCADPANQHARHWGPQGAAGALAWLTCSDGVKCVLLARRSKHVQQGGTWAFPGGAIDKGEDSLSAAIREMTEEITGTGAPKGLTGVLEAPCQHGCGWQYTSFVIETQASEEGWVPDVRVAAGRSAWETSDVAWFPLDEVGTLELHPGFRASWPALRRMIEQAG